MIRCLPLHPWKMDLYEWHCAKVVAGIRLVNRLDPRKSTSAGRFGDNGAWTSWSGSNFLAVRGDDEDVLWAQNLPLLHGRNPMKGDATLAQNHPFLFFVVNAPVMSVWLLDDTILGTDTEVSGSHCCYHRLQAQKHLEYLHLHCHRSLMHNKHWHTWMMNQFRMNDQYWVVNLAT